MKMKNSILIALSVLLVFTMGFPLTAWGEDNIPPKFSYLINTNLTQYDFKNSSDIVETYTFLSKQKWPDASKMPEGFDPQALIEWGKNPGLNIKSLNAKGYTGRGVNVAFVDQPLLLNHEQYKDANVNYYMTEPNSSTASYRASFHGPAMLSLLAGKTIGVAPEANIYFFGTTGWEGQSRSAKALYELIKVNDTLPSDQKIKVVGISDFVSNTEAEADQFKQAIQDAEAAGIMVITTNSYFNVNIAYIPPYVDKENYKNYMADYKNDATITEVRKSETIKMQAQYSTPFYIPGGARTVADGSIDYDWNDRIIDSIKNDKNNFNPIDNYVYCSFGGQSNCVPYLVGVITLGLQVNPNLTKAQIAKYMYDSAHPFLDGKIINPEGFLDLVKANCKTPRPIDSSTIIEKGVQQKHLINYIPYNSTDLATGIGYGMQDYKYGSGLDGFDLDLLMAAKVGENVRFYFKHNFKDNDKVNFWIQNDTDTYRKYDTINIFDIKLDNMEKPQVIEIPINKLLKTNGISFGFNTRMADGSFNGSMAAHINTFATDYENLSSDFTATLNAKGKVINGSTMIPMRALFELLGYTIQWDKDTKTVTAVNSQIGKTISLSINGPTAKVDDADYNLPVAPQLIDNSTFIPLRFVSEHSGYDVAWNNTTKEATITVKYDNESNIVYTIVTK